MNTILNEPSGGFLSEREFQNHPSDWHFFDRKTRCWFGTHPVLTMAGNVNGIPNWPNSSGGRCQLFGSSPARQSFDFLTIYTWTIPICSQRHVEK